MTTNNEKKENARARLAGAMKAKAMKNRSHDARKAKTPVNTAVLKSFASAPPMMPAITISCQMVVA
jgi:hypothetical protein